MLFSWSVSHPKDLTIAQTFCVLKVPFDSHSFIFSSFLFHIFTIKCITLQYTWDGWAGGWLPSSANCNGPKFCGFSQPLVKHLLRCAKLSQVCIIGLLSVSDDIPTTTLKAKNNYSKIIECPDIGGATWIQLNVQKFFVLGTF